MLPLTASERYIPASQAVQAPFGGVAALLYRPEGHAQMHRAALFTEQSFPL